MSVPVAQVNARIDPRLKEEGDAGLAAAGYTPTQAVRALWQLAAAHQHDPSEISARLEDGGVEKGLSLVAERRSTFERARRAVEDAYGAMGLQVPRLTEALSDDELNELAYRERGLL